MPSIRHVKVDEEGSADAHHRGYAKTGDKGKPVWPAGNSEGQCAGEGLWGRGRTEFDDRGCQGVNAELVEKHPSADRWEEALRWMQVCECSWGEKSLWIRLSYGS